MKITSSRSLKIEAQCGGLALVVMTSNQGEGGWDHVGDAPWVSTTWGCLRVVALVLKDV